MLFWDTILRESVPDLLCGSWVPYGFTNPCGEIPLCPYDSCRLLAINLYSYVVNPFTPDAYFDYDFVQEACRFGQRIMDDIIDLESEKIEMILAKIDSDPESMEVRQTERHLWEKIQRKTLQGRQYRCGHYGGRRYDCRFRFALWNRRRSNRLCGTYAKKTLALAAYRSSVMLAKERGAFEIFDAKREEKKSVHQPFA